MGVTPPRPVLPDKHDLTKKNMPTISAILIRNGINRDSDLWVKGKNLSMLEIFVEYFAYEWRTFDEYPESWPVNSRLYSN